MKPRISQLAQSGASDGDVVTWDNTDGEWVPAAPTGGGGSGITVQDENGTVATGVTQLDFQGAAVTAASGSGEVVVTVTSGGGSTLVHIDDPSLWGTLLSETYEFDADTTSLPSGWSWMNQGSATYKEKFGKGKVSFAGNASYNSRGIYRAVPGASTWSAVLKLNITLLGVSGSPSANAGVFLRGSTGKILQYGTFSSGNIGLEQASAPTTYAGNAGLVTTQFVPILEEVYFRIKKNSSTSYDFGISADGVEFDDTSAAYDPTAFLGTISDFGIYANSTATTRKAIVACEWLRVS
jgi:hypothetical protein